MLRCEILLVLCPYTILNHVEVINLFTFYIFMCLYAHTHTHTHTLLDIPLSERHTGRLLAVYPEAICQHQYQVNMCTVSASLPSLIPRLLFYQRIDTM